MNITPLFPTPIGKVYNFITEKERLRLLESIKKRKHVKHGAIIGNGSSSYSVSSNVFDRDIVKRLQDSVNEYVEEYGCKDVKFQHSWSSVQNKGSRLSEHTHQNAIVSGALYINVDQSCKLYFHNPNPYIFYTDRGDDSKEVKEFTPYTYEHYWIPVENSLLVLFPGWLRHGKNDEDSEMDNRIVVSFNFG